MHGVCVFTVSISHSLSTHRHTLPVHTQELVMSDGTSCVHLSVEAQTHEVLKVLIDEGCNVNARDWRQWTPAHIAASKNDTASLTLLGSPQAMANLKVTQRLRVWRGGLHLMLKLIVCCFVIGHS